MITNCHISIAVARFRCYYSNIKSIIALLTGGFMTAPSAHEPPGWDEDPAWLDRDPLSAAEREAWLDRLCAQDDDPFDQPEEYWDPEASLPPPGQDELTEQELAGIGAAAADEMLALGAASTGRRGPGQAGSARVFPGVSDSRAAGFGTGMAWDVMPGCAQLAVAADAAVDGGPGDLFGGVADHELVGLVCAWDRLEAHMAARKLVALAEVFRRNPEDGFEPSPGQMPAVVHEFTRDQLALALGESRAAADWLLTVAWHLATRLGETLGALTDGVLTRGKTELIVRLTQFLSDDEAKAVEAKVLDRAGRLTPGGLRSALARTVMEVAPEKARQRREAAAKTARVERWAEDSGNAALMGRELPPDEVLAADQRITWWASELKKAGLEGGMDELRARAFLDLVLGKDSRPRQDGTAGPAASAAGGFAGRVTLTVPLGTVSGLTDRPGELAGLGPVDPWLARDLAAAAAANPRSTWCVTVTDQHGHAVGHGCARPGSKRPRQRAGPGPPWFSFTPASRDGPPGGYGTWRLRVPGGGPDLIVAIDTLDTQDCEHRYQARGHDPGVKLRHLSQIRHATCTSPVCRRPARTCDFEHNTPYEAGGRTCLCNGGPKCRHDHRLKQQPGWTVDQLPDGKRGSYCPPVHAVDGLSGSVGCAGGDPAAASGFGFGGQSDPEPGSGSAAGGEDAFFDPGVDAWRVDAEPGGGFGDAVLAVAAGFADDVFVLVDGAGGAFAAGGFDVWGEWDRPQSGGSAVRGEVAVVDPVLDGLDGDAGLSGGLGDGELSAGGCRGVADLVVLAEVAC